MFTTAQAVSGVRLSVYNNAVRSHTHLQCTCTVHFLIVHFLLYSPSQVDTIDQPALRTRAFFWEVGIGRLAPLVGR
jgi:hypothetical protein